MVKPMMPRPVLLLALLAIGLMAAGCRKPVDSTASSESTPRDDDAPAAAQDASPSADARQLVATKAKDALFQSLSGRLMEVLQAEGPAAAINVCSQEAVTIAEKVGEEYGVEIGRTSFKLRNPANAPREWVKPFVEQRLDKPHHLELEDGSLGVLFPIRLDVKCLMCHGGPDDMLDDVKSEIASRYPQDEATGFQQGDLRGWFWVEVPPAVDAPQEAS